MILSRSQYDAAYFGDIIESGGLRHEAGYTYYLDLIKEKPYLKRSDRVFNTASERILELGCGIGTYAKIALSRGLDWIALDWSLWAKQHEVTPIIEEDALTYLLAQANNSFDYIVSFGFIECFTDGQLLVLKNEMDRVGINQIHLTYENPNPLYYNTSVKSRILDAIDLVERKVKVVG